MTYSTERSKMKGQFRYSVADHDVPDLFAIENVQDVASARDHFVLQVKIQI